MAEKSTLDWIALVLLIIGGLNWGLVGIASFSAVTYSYDLVALVLGGIPWLAAIVYILVGLSALYTIYYLFKK
jgi:hypothetical protein